MITQMNSVAEVWWNWMWPMFWQVSVLVVFLGAVDLILRRHIWPQVRYALWLLVLIKLILPPTFSLSTSIVSQARIKTDRMATQFLATDTQTEYSSIGLSLERDGYLPDIGIEPFIEPEAVMTNVTNEPQVQILSSDIAGSRTNVKLHWHSYAMAVWLIVIVVLSLWVIIRFRKLRKFHAGKISGPDLPSWFGSLLTQTAEKLGLRKLPEVALSRNISSPAVFGVFRPVLVLPVATIHRLSRKRTEHILLHELAHIKRGDLLVNTFYMLLQIVYWFNPLLWLIRRRLQHIRELCCDATVARILKGKTTDYRDTILEVTQRFLAKPVGPGIGLLGMTETSSRLLVRLKWLEKKTWRYRGIRIATMLIVVAVMSVCVLPMAKAKNTGVLTVAADGSEKYSSIQEAIDAADEGAEIRIGPGVYEERLRINKPVTLAGAGWNQTTIITISAGADVFEEVMRTIEARMREAKTDEQRKSIEAKFKAEFKEKYGMPTLLVSGTKGVVIRDLKLTSPARPLEGRTMSVPILKFSNAKASVSKCAVIGTPGDGLHILDGSDVEICDSLVAAVWSTGIVIGERQGAGSSVRLLDSELRNCHYAGIRIREGNDSTRVERCRISGAAWHGIRYDNVSPTIVGNIIFANARSGIYASGKTAATVKQNLFYANEMVGMSCWSSNQDTIEGNTFADNKRSGLEVLGASKPTVRKNIFFANPAGVSCGDIASDSVSAKSDGVVTLEENLFWKNQAATKKTLLPEGMNVLQVDPLFTSEEKMLFSLRADSPARRSGIGVAEPIGFKSPWPIQPEEAAIIPNGLTRDSREWKQQAQGKPAAKRPATSRTSNVKSTEKSAAQYQAQPEMSPGWIRSDWPGCSIENNYALQFDGTDDYVKIPASNSLDIRGSLTLSAWVKNNGDNDGQIIWRGDNQSARDPYELHIDSGKMEFRIDGGKRGCYRISSDKLADNRWHFWSGVYDKLGGEIRLYQDAVLVSAMDIEGDIGYDTSTMWNMIGAVDFGNWQHFKGLIDEAQIWSITRTPEQLKQDMSASLTGNESNLVGYWRFDEGSGSTVRDHSPNHNDGQLGAWTGRRGYIPVGAKAISSYAAEAKTAFVSASLETLPMVKDLPGVLIFHGRYKHTSRGRDYGEPGELWLKRSQDGAVTAIARLAYMSTMIIASGDKHNRFTHYKEKTSSADRSNYSIDLELLNSKVLLTRRGLRQDCDGKELMVPEGALFSPNTRPDSYCAANILHRGFNLKEGQSKEFPVYDWDNSGEAMADYTIRIEHAGTERVDVPAGTFEANHIVLRQVTSADTWFKKRAGHVTDFWILDNGVIVRILRHREPYEIQLLDYTTPVELPGKLAVSEQAKAVPVAKSDLQRMIDSAQAGATIIIPKGIYAGPVTISKPLILKGESRNECIIEVTSNQPAISVDSKGKGKVLIEGVTIKWQLATSDRVEHPFAVAVKDTIVDIKNCCFKPLGNFKRCPVAINSMGFSELNIDTCRFEGFEYTVCFGQGTKGSIRNSLVMDSGHQGISLYSRATAEITGNIVTGSRYHAVRSTGG
ncbi:MAG: M56 family metallopeptidase, partial [Planctomycetota bacterium]